MSEQLRLKDLLEKLFQDIIVEKKTFTSLSEFVEHYTKEVEGKTHPTHVFIELRKNMSYSNEFYQSGTIEKEFLGYLMDTDPKICLGDVCGKHSDVSFKFSELFDDADYRYYNVISRRFADGTEDFHSIPEVLQFHHEKWEVAKSPVGLYMENWWHEKVKAGDLAEGDRQRFFDFYVESDIKDCSTDEEIEQYLQTSLKYWHEAKEKKEKSSSGEPQAKKQKQ